MDWLPFEWMSKSDGLSWCCEVKVTGLSGTATENTTGHPGSKWETLTSAGRSEWINKWIWNLHGGKVNGLVCEERRGKKWTGCSGTQGGKEPRNGLRRTSVRVRVCVCVQRPQGERYCAHSQVVKSLKNGRVQTKGGDFCRYHCYGVEPSPALYGINKWYISAEHRRPSHQ